MEGKAEALELEGPRWMEYPGRGGIRGRTRPPTVSEPVPATATGASAGISRSGYSISATHSSM